VFCCRRPKAGFKDGLASLVHDLGTTPAFPTIGGWHKLSAAKETASDDTNVIEEDGRMR
jgi:hypothetical protein